MKNRINIKSAIFIICISSALLYTICSCSKLISDEFPNYDELPTVNALLVAGEPIKVHVSLAERIDTTILTIINDAFVVIHSQQEGIDTLYYIGGGLYKSVFIAKQGYAYTIETLIDGFDKIIGSDSVPHRVNAKISDHTNYYRYDEEGNFTEGIEIEFYDDPNTTDFYEIAIIREEYSSSYYVYPYSENTPIILNEGYEPYTTPSLVFSDQLMGDSIIRIYFDFYQGMHISDFGNDSLVQIFDEHAMKLEFRHVSESYYNYKKHFYFYEKDRYPGFVEGTASTYPIYSNMENGFGIIGAYSITRDSIWIPEEHMPL